jgi:diguanylate cyclase (GGDEF)-like protein
VLYDYYTILLFAIAGANLLFAIYGTFRFRNTQGGTSFSGLLITLSIYTAFFSLELADLNPWRSHLWAQLQQVALSFLPAFFLLLTLQTTHSILGKQLFVRVLLFIIPTVYLIYLSSFLFIHITSPLPYQLLSLLPPVHHVGWEIIGQVYCNLLFMLLLFRLVTQLGGAHHIHRIQLFFMVMASLPPWLIYLTDLLTEMQPWSSSATPVLLTISPVLFAFSIFGYRFLDYNPIAREVVFDRMLEAIILTDLNLRIIDYNQAATRIFPELDRNALGESITMLYPYAPGLDRLVSDCSDHGMELSENPLGYSYEAHIQKLSQNGQLLGRMLRFTDVTAQVKLRKALEHLATTDALTGALNRRNLLDSLSREIKRAARQKSPLAILFLDLDLFKSINDSYGHCVGDEVLRIFARNIQNNMRSTDIFGRYGGEEFIFVLTGTSKEQALQVAEKVRKSIENQLPLIDGKVVAFTTSIGLAVYDNFETLIDCDLFIQQADTALYQAKSLGRNRVVCWPTE